MADLEDAVKALEARIENLEINMRPRIPRSYVRKGYIHPVKCPEPDCIWVSAAPGPLKRHQNRWGHDGTPIQVSQTELEAFQAHSQESVLRYLRAIDHNKKGYSPPMTVPELS
jgi:hypothetical protein